MKNKQMLTNQKQPNGINPPMARNDCSLPVTDESCGRGKPLGGGGGGGGAVDAHLWHRGSTSPRWRARWAGRSSWWRRGCCRSSCDGWWQRCPPPRSRLPCDRQPGSGCSASGDLRAETERGTAGGGRGDSFFMCKWILKRHTAAKRCRF